jgi:hypothetical protein
MLRQSEVHSVVRSPQTRTAVAELDLPRHFGVASRVAWSERRRILKRDIGKRSWRSVDPICPGRPWKAQRSRMTIPTEAIKGQNCMLPFRWIGEDDIQSNETISKRCHREKHIRADQATIRQWEI